MPFLGGSHVFPFKERLDEGWERGTEGLLPYLTCLTALRVGYSPIRLAQVCLVPL